MNRTRYILRNRKIDKKIKPMIKKFGLAECYIGKDEQILKNDDFLVSLNKKYVFLNVLSEKNKLMLDIVNFLQE